MNKLTINNRINSGFDGIDLVESVFGMLEIQGYSAEFNSIRQALREKRAELKDQYNKESLNKINNIGK